MLHFVLQFLPTSFSFCLGFTPPSPLIFTPTGFGSHLLLAQRSDRARETQAAWSYAVNLRPNLFGIALPCF